MSDNKQVIKLYTELAENPQKDFGWDKGLENAREHGYKEEWIERIPSHIWDFCAAVGNPFLEADIKEGDTVLDLGCGAGVDVLVASHLVGKSGQVYGVDITPKMVEIAAFHAKELDATNVKILESSFDGVALEDETVDVVISNGAINLTSCKESVFAEIYRILKPDGRLQFADMIDISVDEGACCSVEGSSCCGTQEEDWANCVAGTLREDELSTIITNAGFKNVVCHGTNHYTTSDTTKGATFSASKIPSEEIREKHWNRVFKTADYTQVLWHQKLPQKSIDYIKTYANKNDAIIDAGCGASFLVDNLVQEGYENITLLDTSEKSLEIVKERIKNKNIDYICSDILNFQDDKKFDIWHDRALFHFLLNKNERQKYFSVLRNSLKDNATAIISTFRVNGPLQCSGLDIVQYKHEKMFNELPKDFRLLTSEEYTHITPKESEQEYIYFVIQKM